MAYPYEYAMMVQYVTPKTIMGAPNYTEEGTRQSLRSELSGLMKDLPKALGALPSGADWQVNSHSLTLAGNTVVVSILLQRSRP